MIIPVAVFACFESLVHFSRQGIQLVVVHVYFFVTEEMSKVRTSCPGVEFNVFFIVPGTGSRFKACGAMYPGPIVEFVVIAIVGVLFVKDANFFDPFSIRQSIQGRQKILGENTKRLYNL